MNLRIELWLDGRGRALASVISAENVGCSANEYMTMKKTKQVLTCLVLNLIHNFLKYHAPLRIK